MKITKYPDGSSYVSETKLGEQVFRINSYGDLWTLAQFVDAFHSQYDTETTKIKPNIIIPNLIDAQADRRFKKGESFGLKLVCKFLNDLDANFKIFHPHNQELVEGLIDGVEIIDNSEFINRVLSRHLECGMFNYTYDFSKSKLNDSLILMASDAGGFKPLMKLCDKINWRGETFSAAKARSWDEKTGTKFVQKIDRSDFGGKDIMIVDDICIYGGTFKGLSKLLRERNCGKLYLAVSHMTVQNLGEDSISNYFDRVFTSNSKYSEYYHVKGLLYMEPIPNIEILDLF
jgi:ribose-phosphate pyrophosphokinase